MPLFAQTLRSVIFAHCFFLFLSPWISTYVKIFNITLNGNSEIEMSLDVLLDVVVAKIVCGHN
jgi:hypothetical protein